MIELQRNIVFGQYVDTGSAVHELDPRIKIGAATILTVASFGIGGLAGFLLLVPLVVLIQLLSRVQVGYLLRGSRFFLIFLAVILAFNVVFYPAPAQDALWRWHLLSISTAGLRAAALIGLKVLLLYYVTTMLMLVTPMVDLTDGLEALLGPLQRLRVPVNELVLVAVISLKFVPIFTAEAERLSTAQTARGVPFDEGGPLVRARRIGRLLVPLIVGGFRRADVLTMAMDSRCYRGGQGRTKLREFHSRPADWISLALVAIWVAAAWAVSRYLAL